MRVRTRNFTSPTYCTITGLTERFEDWATPSKTWKECLHTSRKVLHFQPSSGSKDSVLTGGRSPIHEDITPTVRRFPGFTWDDGQWRGYVSEVLDIPSSDLTLPNVDLQKVAMDLSRSNTNLAEMIATMQDTVGLFANPARFLKHAVKQGVPVSKRPLRELRDSIDKAGSTWLQGTYGYIPLMSSIIELAQICKNPKASMAKLAKPISQDIRHGTERSYESRRADNINPYYFSEHRKVRQNLSRLIRLEGSPNPSFQALSLANQMASYLGLNDFGRLAWELVPFSFVVDWFTDLGSSVASSSALNGPMAYSNFRVSSALKTRTLTTYTVAPATKTLIKNPYLGIDTTINVIGGSCTVEDIYYYRSPPGGGDTSGSTFSNGLSAYRTATGLALLHGSMGRLTGW